MNFGSLFDPAKPAQQAAPNRFSGSSWEYKQPQQSAVPPQQLQRSITGDSGPPQQQLQRSITGDSGPPQQFQRSITGDSGPPQQFQRSITGDSGPPQQLQRSITGDSGPSQQPWGQDSRRLQQMQPPAEPTWGRPAFNPADPFNYGTRSVASPGYAEGITPQMRNIAQSDANGPSNAEQANVGYDELRAADRSQRLQAQQGFSPYPRFQGGWGQ